MRITIDLADRSYPVIIDSHLLNHALEHLSPYILGKQVCIITNEIVAPLYLEILESQLKAHYQLSTLILPDGEVHKNLNTLDTIFEKLLGSSANRDITLLALGGGVVGDMTGFAAASFMRGVNFIQIPTTLLAQVDSSVGGKTGVNHALGKNMIGAFYQPRCVLANIAVLKTLPQRELSAGLAEVIKYALIADTAFLSWLSENMPSLIAGDENALMHAIKVSCESKANIVAQDEKEKGLRAILNLGHTFGHAIEAYYQYKKYLHGEAVAIGMYMAAKQSQLMGNISKDDLKQVAEVIEAANLPSHLSEKIACDDLISFMQVDKKAQSGQIRLVLLHALGKAVVSDDFSLDIMKEAMYYCMPQ